MQVFKEEKWDLSELVKDPDSPQFAKRLQAIQNTVKNFEKNKKILSPKISEKKFLSMLHQLEDITEEFGRVSGYASLEYSSDTQSDKATALLSKMRKLGAQLENQTLFFDQWWKKQIDEKNAQRLMKSSGELYEFLRYKRLLAKYSLTEPEERIINTLDVTGHSALVKIYDKITNAFVFEVKLDGKIKKYNREELTVLVRSPNPKTREIAYKALLGEFDKNKGVLGEIYQNIVSNWKDECIQIRGYSSPISVRNIGNDTDDKTVESLLAVCKKNSDVFSKFFVQKAKLLNMKKLRRYDIYAPIKKKEEKRYSYDKAVKLVLDTLNDFSPQLSEYARRVFVQRHVDSTIRPGKRSGAFCSTISPKLTPYVLMNFKGRTNDVFTLAHELGHAIHSVAASGKSIFIAEAPLPLAETASTFSEMLLFNKILEEISNEEQQTILVEHIDDLYATVGRQAYFTLFEIAAHDRIGQGAMVQDITSEYMKTLKDQFGKSVDVTPDFGIEWTCIPHFYHSPFYCYSYSFGNLLSLSLYQRYRKEGKSFASTYVDILAAGGSKKPEVLLKEHGIDITSESFWQEGFEYIKNQADRLEDLIN
ncbi:PepF/M3 family oligoendopeptidase [Nitrosotalea sinensis]|uniref:PepF/M3 family oligoendopeptidase n=1 Tax=Nitrosotalea sinensis TaxID=1499975 RepID=A0A2H1EIN4_9ARCH|nr:M3 family oligoendopeptidase [Candidatus Nitrosotalea sinensis]SHO46413.1 PepF/M3 family oligoendopeptidase [Candidatus Nitrosotalea sinensis]